MPKYDLYNTETAETEQTGVIMDSDFRDRENISFKKKDSPYRWIPYSPPPFPYCKCGAERQRECVCAIEIDYSPA